MSRPYEDQWRQRAASSPLREAVSFSDDGHLVLGRGTILHRLNAESSGTFSLRADAAHGRMLALLAVAGRGRLAKAALLQLDAALADWHRGDRGLAAIRLVFAPLPKLRDPEEAYPLFLAETALDDGLSPDRLLRALDYFACVPLLKFDPSQPRVPAGSGTRSGQWTSEGATTGGPDRSAPASTRPAAGTDVSAGTTSVLFRPVDPDEQDVEDKWRRLGIGGTEQDRIDDGTPLIPPAIAPGGASPPRFGVPDPGGSDLETPGSDAVPGPMPGPSGDEPPPPGAPPPDDRGPPCPPQQKDRPRGTNANADMFEYMLSLIVNPSNPTPKQSPVTPNVVSQAYYLPTPTPDGKSTYDDCKQDATPIPIPDVRPGDMFEFKSGNVWQLYYTDSEAYEDFEKQVRNQNAGVATEGLGRKRFYCFDNQALANTATKVLGEQFPNSRFLVCH